MSQPGSLSRPQKLPRFVIFHQRNWEKYPPETLARFSVFPTRKLYQLRLRPKPPIETVHKDDATLTIVGLAARSGKIHSFRLDAICVVVCNRAARYGKCTMSCSELSVSRYYGLRWAGRASTLIERVGEERAVMSLSSVLSEVWEIVPILLLLLVGGLVAVRSGADRLASGRDFRQIARNLSQMILRVAGYVAVLLALQYWIGQRPMLGW